MSLSEKLKESADKKTLMRPCKVNRMLNSGLLSEEEKTYIIKILDSPFESPGRISNAELSRVMRSEGWDLSASSFDRHVRGTCGCFNLSVRKNIF